MHQQAIVHDKTGKFLLRKLKLRPRQSFIPTKQSSSPNAAKSGQYRSTYLRLDWLTQPLLHPKDSPFEIDILKFLVIFCFSMTLEKHSCRSRVQGMLPSRNPSVSAVPLATSNVSIKQVSQKEKNDPSRDGACHSSRLPYPMSMNQQTSHSPHTASRITCNLQFAMMMKFSITVPRK